MASFVLAERVRFSWLRQRRNRCHFHLAAQVSPSWSDFVRLPRNRICKCRCLGLGMGFVSVVPTPRLAPGLARTLPKAPSPASRPACLGGWLPSSLGAAAPIGRKFAAMAQASRAEPRRVWRRRGCPYGPEICGHSREPAGGARLAYLAMRVPTLIQGIPTYGANTCSESCQSSFRNSL